MKIEKPKPAEAEHPDHQVEQLEHDQVEQIAARVHEKLLRPPEPKPVPAQEHYRQCGEAYDRGRRDGRHAGLLLGAICLCGIAALVDVAVGFLEGKR